MAKLVVFLPEGRNVDVKLDRERVTIGRRPDNDVCLPYPAVSGEHAAVVTILADSFLEDVGSTNGTLVNGKPVAKHFLRDRDRIDIGKQKLIYLADESEKLEPDPPEVAHRDVRLLAERVDAARARAALQAAGRDRRPPPPAVDPALAALGAELDAMPESASVDSLLDAPGSGAIRGGAGAGGRDAAGGGGAGGIHAAAGGTGDAGAGPAPGASPSPGGFTPAPPLLRVLNGPAAGHTVALAKDEVIIGRPGRAVAAIRRTEAGRLLVPVEGGPATVNGAPVPAEGTPVAIGDRIDLGGVALEIVAPAP
jgi:hypothetical protein